MGRCLLTCLAVCAAAPTELRPGTTEEPSFLQTATSRQASLVPLPGGEASLERSEGSRVSDEDGREAREAAHEQRRLAARFTKIMLHSRVAGRRRSERV